MFSSSKQTIEHVVLLKVKDNIDQSKVKSMLNGLNGLITLDQVLHLTAGPVIRSRSSSLNFTHMLHSRYDSKEDLNGYSEHPSHVSVVKEHVLPICDDVMAIDWIADDLQGPIVPPPGSAMRVTFLKLKENLGDGMKSEILAVIKGIKNSLGHISQLTCGENFSMARGKGFSIASIVVFPSVSEMEVVDSNKELVDLKKQKVRDYLESVVVVDYAVSLSYSANL